MGLGSAWPNVIVWQSAESSDDLMFLKVCCGVDLDTSFASYLLQDDEITLLRTPYLENFFLVCILIDVASSSNSNPILHKVTANALAVDSLVWISIASKNL